MKFRGNMIPMEHSVMDRIEKFGEGLYRYNNRGLVVQNAREEKFQYNSKGLLVINKICLIKKKNLIIF